MRRRDFIIGLALVPVGAIATGRASGLERRRAPYVSVGEFPDSIAWHLWDRPAMPIGPLAVHQVLPWDGVGYPVVMAVCGWREADRILYEGGYDHDWSVLRRDVPADFWRQHYNRDYPNIHAYVREQRFGEPPSTMRAIMDRNAAMGPPAGRPRRVPLKPIPQRNPPTTSLGRAG